MECGSRNAEVGNEKKLEVGILQRRTSAEVGSEKKREVGMRKVDVTGSWKRSFKSNELHKTDEINQPFNSMNSINLINFELQPNDPGIILNCCRN
jgi:hypothetical protein